MKNSIHVYFAFLFAISCLTFSCKKKTIDRYAYDPNKDTIPPVLAITVPIDGDNYLYGEDIHIVGTATDLQSRDNNHINPGKLQSLYLNISIIDPGPDTVIKTIFQKSPYVDGKDGVTINEKTFLNSGSGVTYCRFTGVAIDYSGRRDSSVSEFWIH